MEKIRFPKKKGKRVNYLPLVLMMLPGILYLLVNNYLPMFGIMIAFKKLKSLKDNKKFNNIIQTGKWVKNNYFVIYYLESNY
ncbi:MAG: hypothetical protein OSJ52_10335, partial [Lachnospiraceae bacterium]|nr:hypothetical protein [Lachnospiraceae bacterium]